MCLAFSLQNDRSHIAHYRVKKMGLMGLMREYCDSWEKKNLERGTVLFRELTIFPRRFLGRRWAKTQIA